MIVILAFPQQIDTLTVSITDKLNRMLPHNLYAAIMRNENSCVFREKNITFLHIKTYKVEKHRKNTIVKIENKH